MRKVSKWFVGQIGRREAYALPAALSRNGLLARFHTDIWASNFPDKLLGGFCPSLFLRSNPALAAAAVSSAPLRSFYSRLRWPRRRSPTVAWTREGELFGAGAVQAFVDAGFADGDVSLGYTCGNLEMLRLAQSSGGRAFHVQIDPGLHWYALRDQIRLRYADAEPVAEPVADCFKRRLRQEWEAAHIIVCHSRHTREALARYGVPHEKMHVVPLGYVPAAPADARSINHSGKKRALFLGTACLMKGFHDYCSLARALHSDVEFHCAGKVEVSREFISANAEHVIMHGHLSPSEVRALLQRSDVLVFPTHSDGFGLVQLEAMSMGVPVLSSWACGDVVVDGVNGYRFTPGDTVRIQQLLRKTFSDCDTYVSLSHGAIKTSTEYSPDRQLQAYLDLLEGHVV